MTWVFPSLDTLRFALTGGVVPPAVALAPVRAGQDINGRTWLSPLKPLPDAVRAQLVRLGVESRPDGEGGTVVESWPQALPLQRRAGPPEVTPQTAVLFELPDNQLAELVGELLRLGNDRQSYRLAGDGTALLRVLGPPYYSLLRALDRAETGPIAYAEQAPRVFVEVGYSHPLGSHLKPAAGQVLLLRPPADWRAIDDAPFRDIYDVLEFDLPAVPRVWADAPLAAKLRVPLRLAPAASTDPAELWVLHDLDALDAFVRDAGEMLISRLAFAVARAGERTIAVVRSRPGKGDPPVLVLPADAYRQYLRLPNLFVPVNRRVHPPLRRDALRRRLADDPAQVTWLQPDGDAAFVPHSLPETAFRPLAEWVDYVLDHDRQALHEWAGSFRFEFAPFVCRDEVPAGPKPPPVAAKKPKPAKPEAPAEPPKVKPVTPIRPAPVPLASAEPVLVDDRQSRAELAELERQFLAVDGPLDAPERLALWPRLAELNDRLGLPHEAALCRLAEVWERLDAPAGEVAAILANYPAAAAFVESAGADAARQFESADHAVPVRAAWLAWRAAAQSTGDVLLLARARDRLLERLLANGLSAERDLPTFLRYAGTTDGQRLRQMGGWIERLHQAAREWWQRDPPPVRKESDATPAYIDLTFAFALARTASPEAARRLVEAGTEALGSTGDETHTFLLQAFRYRIEQAINDQPHAGPLPATMLEYLEHLRGQVGQAWQSHVQTKSTAMTQGHASSWNHIYLIDRYREQSRVIDPQEKFNPYQSIDRTFSGPVSMKLAQLADVTDKRLLATEVRKLWQDQAGERPGQRAKVLELLLPLAVRAGRPVNADLLAGVKPTAEAALQAKSGPPAAKEAIQLLERGVLFAAHLDRPELAEAYAELFTRSLSANPTRPVLEAAGPFVAQALRSLRKLGRADASRQLLDDVTKTVVRDQDAAAMRARDPATWPYLLRVLLHLAGGWLYSGDAKPAAEAFAAARDYLFRRENRQPLQWLEYVGVAGAYAAAVGQAPFADAAPRLEELFAAKRLDSLPNTFTTASHYSRFHVNVVEAVALAVSGDDFALGAAARRWLDDDEYLVRRRIHRDTRKSLGEAGW